MLTIFCPRCGTPYHAEESQVGKKIRCHAFKGSVECGEVIEIRLQKDKNSRSNLKSPATVKSKIDIVVAFRGRKQSLYRAAKKWQRLLLTACSLLIILSAYYLGRFYQSKDKMAPKPSTSHQGSDGSGLNHSIENVIETAVKADQMMAYRIESPALSLSTGTRIIHDAANRGHGRLRASNGTTFDTAIYVLDAKSNKQIRGLYIKAHDSFVFDHLNPGGYRVLFMSGLDWNGLERCFDRDDSYFEFGKILYFEESEDAGTLHYGEHTITLNPVPEGDVHPKELSKAEFQSLIAAH
jgi:hypothetical protein